MNNEKNNNPNINNDNNNNQNIENNQQIQNNNNQNIDNKTEVSNTSNKQEEGLQNEKIQKVKKTYTYLVVIGLIFAFLRLPYLSNMYLKHSSYLYKTNLYYLLLGILAIITYIITVFLNSESKKKYVLGLISGILTLITGNLISALIGLLLIIDSIRAIRNIK